MRDVLLFAILAGAILACLFRDAILHGHVLGQADFLFEFQPWQSHAAEYVRPANPLIGDSPLVFYPFLVEACRAMRSGRFPLWSAATYAGQPFFASYQSAVLSPFTLLGCALPLPEATTAIAAARLAAGGAGMFVFLRSIGLGWWGAAFGGTAYLLNPFSYVWLEHPLSAVAAWLPWLLYAVRRAAADARARDAGVVAIATALVLLAGHPETAFKILLFCAAYGVFAAATSDRSVRGLVLVAGGMALGALLSAVQIVPFLEYLRESRILAFRSNWAQLVNPPNAFIVAFVPDFFGNPSRGAYFHAVTNYCEQAAYPAMAVWILAAVALTRRTRRREILFFAASALAAGLIMYGSPLAWLISIALPPLRVAALSRFGIVLIAGLIVVASFGVDAIADRAGESPPHTGRLAPAIAAALGALAIAALVVAWFQVERPVLVEHRYLPRATHAASVAAWFALAGVIVVGVRSLLPPRIVGACLTALVAADLLVFGQGFHPLMRKDLVFPPLPEIAAIRADQGVYRATGFYQTFLPNVGMVYGIQDFRGYDGVGVNAYLDLLDLGFKNIGSTHALVHFLTPHLIDLLNIKYVMVGPDVGIPERRFTEIAGGPVRVLRNDRVQPRAFLVDRAVVLTGTDAKRALRSGAFDFRRCAVLDEALPAALAPEGAGADPGRATIALYEDERIEIVTNGDGRRLLIVSDVFYPGWTATVDGAPARILRADVALRAVAVPAGQHVVRFVYAPASFRIGLAGTGLAGVVVCVLLIGPGLAGRRRSPKAAPPGPG